MTVKRSPEELLRDEIQRAIDRYVEQTGYIPALHMTGYYVHLPTKGDKVE